MKKNLLSVILLQGICLCAYAQQTPDLHVPTSTNNTANYWGGGAAPTNYNFPTNESVVINHDTNCGSNFDTCANHFPSLVLHGSGTAFHSALLMGTNGNIELRRTYNSSIGLDIRTKWTNDQGSLNTAGGFISFSPRGLSATNGQYEPVEAMRIIAGGNVGIGTTSPSEQLHTTSGVRFAGLTSTTAPPRTIVSDSNGKLFYVTGAPVTSSCSTANTIPMMTGTNAMGCSNITQLNSLGNCTGGGTHIGVGINGTPVATATSGSTCYNIMLTVNGSALANGGLWIASDRRLKKDIVPIKSGLEKVMQMRAVNYDYDNREFPDMELPRGTTAGFIAQELMEVIPEAVGVTENDLHVLNYDIIVPYLVSSIQEQNKILEEQKTLIDELFQRLAKIDSKLLNEPSKFNDWETVPKLPNYIKVSPNPFKNNLSVTYKIEEESNPNHLKKSFKLFNSLGQEVFTFEISDYMGEFDIDTSNLPSGIYFLNFFENNKTVKTVQVTK